MAYYRLFFFSGDGHIQRSLDLECDGDAEAIDGVEEHRGHQALELWQRARLVARFEPLPSQD